jgi:hypothetical protein
MVGHGGSQVCNGGFLVGHWRILAGPWWVHGELGWILAGPCWVLSNHGGSWWAIVGHKLSIVGGPWWGRGGPRRAAVEAEVVTWWTLVGLSATLVGPRWGAVGRGGARCQAGSYQGRTGPGGKGGNPPWAPPRAHVVGPLRARRAPVATP